MSAIEVKGAWFVTAKNYLVSVGGTELCSRVVLHVAPEHRYCLEAPMPSAWYPEAALEQALGGMRSELARRSPERFERIIEECTVIGISRFFRVLLRLSSPDFVLRQVPTMWRQIRRGGSVSVETEPGHCLIRYREFPYFDNENYRLLTTGSLTALVKASTRKQPKVRVQDYGADWLDVSVIY